MAIDTVTDEREAAIAAFADIATDTEIEKAEEVERAVGAVVLMAQGIVVRNAEEAEGATEFLSTLAGEKKRSEEARKFLVQPLNEHVKAINARFKLTAAPLEEADRIVRDKVLAYRREQERLAAEAQARLDEERRERERAAAEVRAREEAEARAAREQAAREAAAAEAEQRRIAQEAARVAERQDAAMRAELNEMTDDALKIVVREGGDRATVAAQIRKARRDAREAQERAEAARRAEVEAREAEQAAKDAPPLEEAAVVVAAPAKLQSASGSIAERKVWKGTVEEENLVPREYLVVDQSLINAAVRRGVRSIPGVRIEQVAELAVRAK